MKKAGWGWKLVAILLALMVAFGFATMLGEHKHVTAFKWLEYASMALCTLGLIQYAFGAPRLPRLVWRVFGPIFSIVLVAGLGKSIGWLGALLAIRSLTLSQQVAATFVVLLLLGYGFVSLVPLYRLAEWKHLKGSAPDENLATLTDTFA